jgi:hypothetical protein
MRSATVSGVFAARIRKLPGPLARDKAVLNHWFVPTLGRRAVGPSRPTTSVQSSSRWFLPVLRRERSEPTMASCVEL